MSDLLNPIRTMTFHWHALVPHEDAQLIGICAEQRCQRRWRIDGLTWRITRRDLRSLIEINWTYGPVHGGRPDDGRKFIERVLSDALDRHLVKDLRDDYPDVVIMAQGESEALEFLPKPYVGG